MKILLSNDDGYFATGIQILFAAIQREMDFESLVIMAPERNRSAASNSLTLLEPLRLHEHASSVKDERCKVFSVNGTPTDCVHLGVNGGLDYQPDIVLSGINSGANMGDDVIYSGTVAAATEARFLGKPSIAISLCGETHFETAAHVLLTFLQDLPKLALSSNTVININVPDVPLSDLKGIKVTRLGCRHVSEPIVSQNDPRGLPIHWIGPAGKASDSSEGTDFAAVESGYASITPLKIDLTNYQMMSVLEDWATESAV
ncbi:MAG: 5'/3'-nucleotidase SurE [Gammaproteobacteria bacterium]|nr:5'/3'-nucleotidase SurE [Gammaproteobacteria bacterium]